MNKIKIPNPPAIKPHFSGEPSKPSLKAYLFSAILIFLSIAILKFLAG